MANQSYTAFRNGILTGLYDLDTAVLKVAVYGSYTFNAAHTFISDLSGAGAVLNGTPVALTGVTVTGGVFDADDVTYTTTAAAGNHCLIVYQASAPTGGADVATSAQRLCWYFDTGTNFPLVPGTGQLSIAWPSTSGKIYKVG